MTMILFLAFFFSLLFTVFCYRPSTKKENHKQLPSPGKLPIIGNFHQVGQDRHISLRSLAQRHGPMMLLHLASTPVVVVTSVAAAREIMKTQDLAFSDRPVSSISRRFFYNYKDVAFSPYSEYWRQVKSMCIVQLLSNKRIQSFQNVRDEEVGLLIKSIKDSPSEGVNLRHLFAALSNNVVCRIALGRTFEGSEVISFKKMLVEMSELLSYSILGDRIPWLVWLVYFRGFKGRVDKVAKDIDVFLEDVVRDHIIALGNDVNQDFVSILLENWKHHTEEDGFSVDKDGIKAVVLDMFAAGTETTSTTLEWIMAALIKSPAIMFKLQNEVREIGKGKLKIEEGDLVKMPYLKAVIKESLRLYTPAPLLARQAREDVSVLGYKIKAQTRVIINVWAIARDPALWECPEEFKPERFFDMTRDYKGLHYEFLPFGAGRRGCPGILFGMTVVELALANVLNVFEFALPGGRKMEDLDMSSTTGINVTKKYPLVVIAKPHQ